MEGIECSIPVKETKRKKERQSPSLSQYERRQNEYSQIGKNNTINLCIRPLQSQSNNHHSPNTNTQRQVTQNMANKRQI